MTSGGTDSVEVADRSQTIERSVSAPPDQRGPSRELSHEEFDPKGTLVLILGYFVILVVMWVFMYFVEFLGNELVVLG